MNERRKKMIQAYSDNKIPGFELLLDNVCDSHNVAAVSRTADGLGISKINLYYTYNEFPEFDYNGHKSSASATRWMDFEKVEDPLEFAKQKKSEGYTLVGTYMDDTAKTVMDYDFSKKTIVMMGSEKRGLSKEIKEICDELMYIPMVGMVQSYNISVSASIVMYELYRQRGHLVDTGLINSLRGNRDGDNKRKEQGLEPRGL
ncbi:MAG: tRNA methyltransferase [Candidatus Cloacimonadota bacterium]|nr:MAG: tRNA methyltransferase [Candidatus Cloacimonadota bacterium]